MPAYWVARSKINDPVEYKKYTDLVPAIIAKHGGKVLARGGRYQIMEGQDKFHRFIVLEFPTFEQGVACFTSDEYNAAAAFRRNGAGEVETVIVDAGRCDEMMGAFPRGVRRNASSVNAANAHKMPQKAHKSGGWTMLRSLKTAVVAFAAGAAFAATALFAAPSYAQAPAGEPIKIGFSMALTGPLAANGKQALLGMKIWEEETNAKGGLLGRPVKLVFYDDQSNPSTVPGIYTKLIDVDKVELVLGPYATNMAAPAMPVIVQKKKAFIILFGLDVNHEFKYDRFFAMIPTGPNTKPSFTEGFFEVAAKQNPKPTTAALIAADAEFSRNACEGARDNAKKYGLRVVYDKTYPPATTDFVPIVRAIQAANPDVVAICSYPLDSVGMVRAVNELNYKPKLIGGAMVGLQATVFKNQLGPLLNGWVNYETWVPDKKMTYEGTDEFFKKYQARAQAEGVDPLGYYLGGWGYAYIQVLGDAVKGANSIDDGKLADYIKANTFKTIHGPIKFGKGGEWAEGRMLQVQYHGIKQGAGLDVWRGMSYQNVLTPGDLKTGDLIYPYEKAKN